MDMSLDQSATPTRRFWRTWRREIIRGGVLFGLVVGTGLFIRSVRIRVPSPLGALGSFGDFNWGDGDGGDLFGRGRQVGDAWEYRALIKPTQHVWIRNTNGPIEVVAGTGDSLVINVEKSWRNSDPQSVQLIPVLTERGLTVCAVWEARDQRCNEGGDYRMNGVKKNDVAVRFTVQLPRSVPIDASTVNGSVSAGLPVQINANVDAETVNGRVETDFPVKITGKISTRHLRGTIGTGGPTLKLITVNGSITLHEADANPNPNPNPESHRAHHVSVGHLVPLERKCHVVLPSSFLT